MLDVDSPCGRQTPSVAAMIYWGTKETLLPVYTNSKEAVSKHPDVNAVVNFARVLGAQADRGHCSHR